jgi:hypothetical protein
LQDLQDGWIRERADDRHVKTDQLTDFTKRLRFDRERRSRARIELPHPGTEGETQ